MSDPITPDPTPTPTPTDPNAAPVTPDPSAVPDATPAQDAATDWKAEARKWESRAKENKSGLTEALGKIQTFEDRDKSELQKAVERAEAAEAAVQARKEADDAAAAKAAQAEEHSKLVAEIAAAKSLDATAVAALRGSTREELESHADILKPLISSPLVIPGQGDTPNNEPSEEAAFVRGLFGRSN